MEIRKEGLVGGKTTKQRAIETVHCLAEETNDGHKDEKYGGPIGQAWPFYHHGLMEGFTTLDDLGLGNVLSIDHNGRAGLFPLDRHNDCDLCRHL